MSRTALLAFVLLPFALVAPLEALAATTRPDSTAASAAPAPKRACDAPEAHQFDFWIGDWEVKTPDGKPAGTNRVDRVIGGCAIQEHWVGVRGMIGTSLNMYVPSTKRWHQTWIDDRGTLLLLDGAYQDGAMVLTGEGKPGASSSKPSRERITWSRLDGGDVRQLWEQSLDGGATWKVVFDGRYHKKA
jgi:hypothetical protein